MVRIRKNLHVSPLFFSSNVAPEDFWPHICRLNQSPWDVNPPPELEAQEDLNVYGSLKGSIGATESVALPSRMNIDKVIIDVEEDSKGFGEGNEIGLKKQKICKKNDGKGWKCRKEVKEGYSFCNHHITLIRSYHNTGSNNATSNANKSFSFKKPKVTTREAPEAKAKKGSSSKSNDYIYYSLFSPWWNQNRRTIVEEQTAKNIAVENGATTSSTSVATPNQDPPSPKAGNQNQSSYVDVNEGNDDGSNKCRRKRMRKPMKAVLISS
ncbi:uncharacterized protein LOC133718698 isoform X1 [Rosa rugosa]|uniref:uncharacterized protein LOC133718698 isoform X1 n=1 Tax=Rosa rugosa TaxID=74645 RepID=UPI002B40A94F|nr:uncharacterized protein LOC133718698 isoform X1 [Rosa rugosa]